MMAAIVAAVVVASAAGTAFVRERAVQWGLVDVPNERSLHTRIMPRGGGIVIVTTALGGLLALALCGLVAPSRAAAFGVTALVVAAVGWLDDMVSVSPYWRLLVHALAACGAVAVWGAFDTVTFPGFHLTFPLAAMASAVTVLWIVGLINAYNFMDGIDGLAAAVGVAAGVTWMWAGASASPLTAGVAGVIAGGSAGFLLHNWSPARIFMGDVGSGFLGFGFAVLPLIAFEATDDARFPVVGMLIVAPFIFDTIVTFGRRLVTGENVLRAHRSHLYQRLVLSGWPHRRVAALYVVLTAACGTAGAMWVGGGPGAVVAAAAAAVFLLPVIVARAERGRSRAVADAQKHVE